MENGEITDAQISASSEYDIDHACVQGRLNFMGNHIKQGAWVASPSDVYPWQQIDLLKHNTRITRVATQGRHNHNQWVTKYSLLYANNDTGIFQYYKGQEQQNATKVGSCSHVKISCN